jgi:hypothetical protein
MAHLPCASASIVRDEQGDARLERPSPEPGIVNQQFGKPDADRYWKRL